MDTLGCRYLISGHLFLKYNKKIMQKISTRKNVQPYVCLFVFACVEKDIKYIYGTG